MPETDRRPYVGRPLKRIEDPKLVTGQGQYVDDLKLPGLAALAFLRSPHAHARVTVIRTDAARTAPGVIRVVTATDLGPLRPTPFMAVVPGLKASPYRCLASRARRAASRRAQPDRQRADGAARRGGAL
jgi:carbon-monoxide dehydrogenase large subunit